MATSRSARRSRHRPARTLVIFFAVIALLYGLVALIGNWSPRLGLDLEGGTRITLVADGSPSQTKLKQAAGIIEQRVNGTGVVEPEVSTQGSKNVVVEIPGKNRQDLVAAAQRTAQMRFRIVSYCPQLTQSFCEAQGRPKPGQSKQQPGAATPGGKSGGKPAATPSSGPSSRPSASPSSKPSGKASSSSRPRPAPAFGLVADKPSPKPTPRSSKGSKSAQPAQPPSQPGAPVNRPLAWSKNPGTDWQVKWATAKCSRRNVALVASNPKQPAKSSYRPVEDVPGQPLIACDKSGVKYLLSSAVIEGTDLKSASYGQEQQNLGQWVVSLQFKGEGQKTFTRLSEQMYDGSSSPYAGGRFAAVLDGQVLEAPGFQGVIPGPAQISGNFTEGSARSLANSLKYGALPVKFGDTSVEVIGPSLAGNQLSAGILAGVVGLLIVMAYCLLYYRGLGIVVVSSLILAGVITYAVVLLLAQAAGFTLTLPGIAGLIVAVGITADSFIVYFERIRDEMREGRSMRVAVEAGWKRARNTCLAADAVSFLAAVVLYIFAIGVVRGFAFALGVSTLIDIAVFFWFTKPMVSQLARVRFFSSGSPMSGLSPDSLGVQRSGRGSATAGLARGRS